MTATLEDVRARNLDRLGLGPRPEPTGGDGARRRPRVRAWLSAHRTSLVVLAGVLVVAAAVHAVGMTRSPAFSDDEGTYLAQAWAVQTRGELAHYTYWYDHPPLGWIQIAAWTWLTDGFDRGTSAIAVGRELMLVVQLVSTTLVFVLARRLGLSRVTAAVAAGAFALSPLAVAYHRMVFLDNLAVAWLLAAFVLACSRRSHLWLHAGAGACFAVASLTKETSLVLLPPLLWLVWTRADRRTRRFCLTAFVSTMVLLLGLYPLFALLKGELLPGPDRVSLFDAIRFQLGGRAGSGSLFDAGAPAGELVRDWLALDPWLLGAGVALLPVGFAVRRLRPVAAALAISVAVALRGGYLPAPYVIALLPFCALLVGGTADALWRARGRWEVPARLAVLASIVATGAWVAPAWVDGNAVLARADDTRPLLDARDWLVANVDRDDRLLVDDTIWVDLVERGFDPELGVVWFSKLDTVTNLDPSVTERLPGGWKEFDWVVVTDVMRQALDDQPGALQDVRLAIERSTPVASWGSGSGAVEVRAVTP